MLAPLPSWRFLVVVACAAFVVGASLHSVPGSVGSESDSEACEGSRARTDADVLLLQLLRGEDLRSQLQEGAAEQEVAARAPLPGTVDWPGAIVPEGGEVRILIVGTSNVVWQTWPDQMHVLLNRLGYTMGSPQLPTSMSWVHPNASRAPVCDDAAAYAAVATPRIGKVGWASWGFAYESRDDCDAKGFRNISGVPVSCFNGWGCGLYDESQAQDMVRPSEIARMASGVHAVILSYWINDARQHATWNVCFNGFDIPPFYTVAMTKEDLLRVIRAIHTHNPAVAVFILSRYPDSADTQVHDNGSNVLNLLLQQGLAGEPNTYVIDFTFPVGVDMFQTKNTGHPNCRGDKVISHSVVDALFQARLIGRSVGLGSLDECLASSDCGNLSAECCHRSAQCAVAQDGACKPYGPGAQ